MDYIKIYTHFISATANDVLLVLLLILVLLFNKVRVYGLANGKPIASHSSYKMKSISM